MIKSNTVKQLYIKSWWRCRYCWQKFVVWMSYSLWFWPEIHHRYFRSQYRWKDRDDIWNLELLCGPCHKLLHNWKLKEFDRKLKQEADETKPKEIRSKEKIKIPKNSLQEKYKERQKQIQKEYNKRQKDFLKSIKR